MLTLTHPSPNHSARRYAGKPVTPVAVCLHWTGGTYKSAVDWCTRDESDVSYAKIVGPNGEVSTLVAPDRSSWSVGKSQAPAPWKGSHGNAMTYNIALAGGPPTKPTTAQVDATVQCIKETFAHFGWPLRDVFRITGHHEWAMPRGRKVDPVGSGWLDLEEIRRRVRGT